MAVVPAVLLVAVQILYPLTTGVARDRVTVAVVLLSAATALTHAARTRGVRWAAGVLVIVSGVGLLAEMVGTATGFPFGCYDYASGRIGPSVAGVPLVVALAWTGGLYPVWIVAGQLYSRTVTRVTMTAAGAVGWDLFLDPQMVADGQWTWCSPWPGLPGLPEIPLTNYLGWFAVGLVMAGLLAAWDRISPKHGEAPAESGTTGQPFTPDAEPDTAVAPAAGHDRTEPSTAHAIEQPVPTRHRPGAVPVAAVRSGDVAVPVAVFLWTWFGSALAHAVFLGLPVSAVYGVVGLGVLGIPLVRALSARRITLWPVRHGTM
ncbi:carotenoid biosynthesis protein [Nocardia sp. CC227C]|uniref:carotenoid biosynthesis protein n=1 Tax=Nocardia sp. CC227C TaxID=3044562 RepID=UPI00278BC551|nr:carotenoid biosynthesis protein [Nocardia sp. CC227C]